MMSREELVKRYSGGAGTQVLLSAEAKAAIEQNVGSTANRYGYGRAQIFSMKDATPQEAEQEAADAKSTVFDMQERGQYPAGGRDARSERIDRSWTEIDQGTDSAAVTQTGGSDYDPGQAPELAPIMEKARKNETIASLFFTGSHAKNAFIASLSLEPPAWKSSPQATDFRTSAAVAKGKAKASQPVVTSSAMRRELDLVDTQQGLAEWKNRGWLSGFFHDDSSLFRKQTPEERALSEQASAASADRRAKAREEGLRRTRFDYGRPTYEEHQRVNATRHQVK